MVGLSRLAMCVSISHRFQRSLAMAELRQNFTARLNMMPRSGFASSRSRINM